MHTKIPRHYFQLTEQAKIELDRTEGKRNNQQHKNYGKAKMGEGIQS